MSKRICPRLASGDSRQPVYAAWPEDIKAGLHAIAQAENASVNWVLEQVVIHFFNLERPVYKNDPAPPSAKRPSRVRGLAKAERVNKAAHHSAA